ncbi:NAD(P)H-dependent oxidoreductase [Ancylomarina sp. YFZ004]
MMSFLELMQGRYTTKKYNPSKLVSEDKIAQLKEILQLSPSSINSQPWRFTFVSDKKTKTALAEASYFNANKVLDASHIVVFSILDDISVFENQMQENLPEAALGYYNQFLKPKKEEEIKAWMSHQVYLSLGFFLSASASMKIDSTSMEGIIPEEYASILNLDKEKPLFAVAIGYRDTDDGNQMPQTPKSRLEYNKVIKSI